MVSLVGESSFAKEEDVSSIADKPRKIPYVEWDILQFVKDLNLHNAHHMANSIKKLVNFPRSPSFSDFEEAGIPYATQLISLQNGMTELTKLRNNAIISRTGSFMKYLREVSSLFDKEMDEEKSEIEEVCSDWIEKIGKLNIDDEKTSQIMRKYDETWGNIVEAYNAEHDSKFVMDTEESTEDSILRFLQIDTSFADAKIFIDGLEEQLRQNSMQTKCILDNTIRRRTCFKVLDSDTIDKIEEGDRAEITRLLDVRAILRDKQLSLLKAEICNDKNSLKKRSSRYMADAARLLIAIRNTSKQVNNRSGINWQLRNCIESEKRQSIIEASKTRQDEVSA